MRVSLKTKLILLISILVLLVVLATSAIYLSALTKQALQGVSSRGEYVANEIYNQAHDILAHSEPPPWTNALQFREQLYEFVTDRSRRRIEPELLQTGRPAERAASLQGIFCTFPCSVACERSSVALHQTNRLPL